MCFSVDRHDDGAPYPKNRAFAKPDQAHKVRRQVEGRNFERFIYAVALCFGAAPLWAGQALPLVDLPQHLHLISVLHRLDDATTLFPEYFARRPQLTPYLGYYYTVSLLNWLFPLELANRIFLSAYVAGLPLSLAFLLKSFKRPAWPSLLALPFAYGDSFAWGFVNYCSALPLAFLTCGFFVRSIAETGLQRRRWAVALAVALVAVLLFHVQVFVWLAFALPLLLVTTRAPNDLLGWKSRFEERRAALLGVVPGVVTFFAWIGMRFGAPPEIAPGQPWRSWGPMLSDENLSYKTFEQNKAEFIPTLSSMLRDGSDSFAVNAAFAIAGLAIVAALVTGPQTKEGKIERWRLVGLAAIAIALYLTLPFDIRGYMYYLNTRYAHLAAALIVCVVPPLKPKPARVGLFLAGALAIATAIPLWKAFAAFDREAAALEELSKHASERPKVMGLIFNTASGPITHPVWLHASTVVARERGGITNFTFALTPHSPVMYQDGKTPPTFASEWRPDTMDWASQGSAYDHFLIRGVPPERILGPQLSSGVLHVAAQAQDFFLVTRTAR